MWIIRKFISRSHLIAQEIQIVKESIFDKRTPFVSRIFLVIAGAYLLLPFDLVSDLIPFLGQVDDVILIPVFITISYFLVPKSVREEVNRKIEREKK
ncbi:MAG: DUF1232 domain-containing protein [Candidatus Roizmanbacteria bacterium]|nr:DUF1232 domain-containing protein [Candidatus Roizmanbacteria bacterium]